MLRLLQWVKGEGSQGYWSATFLKALKNRWVKLPREQVGVIRKELWYA